MITEREKASSLIQRRTASGERPQQDQQHDRRGVTKAPECVSAVRPALRLDVGAARVYPRR
jgi:hypothetical protein